MTEFSKMFPLFSGSQINSIIIHSVVTEYTLYNNYIIDYLFSVIKYTQFIQNINFNKRLVYYNKLNGRFEQPTELTIICFCPQIQNVKFFVNVGFDLKFIMYLYLCSYFSCLKLLFSICTFVKLSIKHRL